MFNAIEILHVEVGMKKRENYYTAYTLVYVVTLIHGGAIGNTYESTFGMTGSTVMISTSKYVRTDYCATR